LKRSSKAVLGSNNDDVIGAEFSRNTPEHQRVPLVSLLSTHALFRGYEGPKPQECCSPLTRLAVPNECWQKSQSARPRRALGCCIVEFLALAGRRLKAHYVAQVLIEQRRIGIPAVSQRQRTDVNHADSADSVRQQRGEWKYCSGPCTSGKRRHTIRNPTSSALLSLPVCCHWCVREARTHCTHADRHRDASLAGY
jgi:hypothetical protein